MTRELREYCDDRRTMSARAIRADATEFGVRVELPLYLRPLGADHIILTVRDAEALATLLERAVSDAEYAIEEMEEAEPGDDEPWAASRRGASRSRL